MVVLLLVSAQGNAKESSPSMTVWVFNLYHSETTRTKVKDYFEHLSKLTGIAFATSQAIPVDDFDKLIDKKRIAVCFLFSY